MDQCSVLASVIRRAHEQPEGGAAEEVEDGKVSPTCGFYLCVQHHRHHDHKKHMKHRHRSGSESERRHRSSSRRQHSHAHRSCASHTSHASNSMTPNEYQLRIHALSTQLALAQSQMANLDRTLRVERESSGQNFERTIHDLQQHNHQLQLRNGEILKVRRRGYKQHATAQVMKTLEQAVQTLQAENGQLRKTAADASQQAERTQRELQNMSEQAAQLNQRNTLLSNKCSGLLANSQQLAAYEKELAELRPAAEDARRQLQIITEAHAVDSERLARLEAQEQLWLQEKAGLEDKLEEMVEQQALWEPQALSDEQLRASEHQLVSALLCGLDDSVGSVGAGARWRVLSFNVGGGDALGVGPLARVCDQEKGAARAAQQQRQRYYQQEHAGRELGR